MVVTQDRLIQGVLMSVRLRPLGHRLNQSLGLLFKFIEAKPVMNRGELSQS